MSRFFARRSKTAAHQQKPARPLGFDCLEARELLDTGLGAFMHPTGTDTDDYISSSLSQTVSAQGLGMLPDAVAMNTITFGDGKTFYLPLPTDTPGGGAQTYQVTSSNPNIQAEVVTGGRSLRLNITINPGGGAPVSGVLTFRLFEDIAPNTTARIIQLVQQGFYNNLTLYRIENNFVAQGGNISGFGDPLDDEFSPLATFTGFGQLAMANSGDDNSTSEFFITDIDFLLGQPDNINPSPPHGAGGPPEFLNFQHTIFGQMTSGFDFFDQVMNVAVLADGRTPQVPVRIDSATIFNDTENGLVRISAPDGFVGSGTITVTTTDSSNNTTMDDFTVNVINDAVNDRPFLIDPGPKTTPFNTPLTFQLQGVDLDGDILEYFYDPEPGDDQRFTVDVNAATGLVTITPRPGFTGTARLRFGVVDTSNRALFDTQSISITVGQPPLGQLDGFVVIPGDGNVQFLMQATLAGSDAAFVNEVGFFVAAADGSVDGVQPTDPNYTIAALSSATRRRLFSSNDAVGDIEIPPVTGGSLLVFYLVQNGTATDALINNPYNTASGPNNVFFSLDRANPDGISHALREDLPGGIIRLSFEDLFGGGDLDYNDLVVNVQLVTDPITAATGQAATIPGSGSRTVTFTLTGRESTTMGELGFFLVDDSTGRIGFSSPTSLGYAEDAISSGRTIFTAADTVGTTRTFTIPGGSNLGFYLIVDGTAVEFLSLNDDNFSDQRPKALFSFPGANLNSFDNLDQLGNQMFFFEDTEGGGDRDFNDVVFRITTT